jgi:hypothetical protein
MKECGWLRRVGRCETADGGCYCRRSHMMCGLDRPDTWWCSGRGFGRVGSPFP